jgi:transposase
MEVPVAGIDVSKDKLIMYFQGKLCEFTNDKRGYEEIRKILPKGCKMGIESSGIYHVNLANCLMSEYDVRIINPSIILL